MSTTDSNSKKFSIKNAASANRNSKTDQNDTKNARTVQSASDDVLTRYDSYTSVNVNISSGVIFSRMAIEEIVKETAKGAIRAEQVGPSGWLPCPLMKTNKRFLRNTIKSVISHNSNKTYKPKKSEEKLNEIIKRGQKRKPKFGDRKHCFRRPNADRAEESGAKSESK